jgi:hypothetical protein
MPRPISCKCGEIFKSNIHEQTMAHIEHLTGRRAGADYSYRAEATGANCWQLLQSDFAEY